MVQLGRIIVRRGGILCRKTADSINVMQKALLVLISCCIAISVTSMVLMNFSQLTNSASINVSPLLSFFNPFMLDSASFSTGDFNSLHSHATSLTTNIWTIEKRNMSCNVFNAGNSLDTIDLTICTAVEVSKLSELDFKVGLLNKLLADIRADVLAHIEHHSSMHGKSQRWLAADAVGHTAAADNDTVTTVDLDRFVDADDFKIFHNLPNVKILRLKFVQTENDQVQNSSTLSCVSSNFTVVHYQNSMTTEACERKYANHTALLVKCKLMYGNISAGLIPHCYQTLAYLGRRQPHILIAVEKNGDALIDGTFGSVHRTGGYYFWASQCSQSAFYDFIRNIKDARAGSHTTKRYRFYREVFVTAMYWGYGFFHNTVETMPRISFYVEFLRAYPDIRIHVSKMSRTADLIELYGIDRSRMVYGDVRAQVVYLPRGGGCGGGCIACWQRMASYFRSVRPHSQLPSDTARLSMPDQYRANEALGHDSKYGGNDLRLRPHQRRAKPSRRRINVILIKRSAKRYLTNHDEVNELLLNVCSNFSLTCIVYGDKPVASTAKTREMFDHAVLIVAPHGAGLANIIFAPAGAYVVEVLCRDEPVNFGIHRFAYSLGHHWHGLLSLTPTPGMVADIKELSNIVQVFLEDFVRHGYPGIEDFRHSNIDTGYNSRPI